ncbi:hypothetical protein BDK51DRAFT_48725 [Blyttiomyces helicus]|uniref:Uncharacterized protein n=1 Tax=Blyttiomyces helicus TaxID=388810 RepID=A0A4P9WI72_9FUNG|nr:hypothetical protein BDK51DRAFT_48725 [Blyttiomyces helicus]|eukprot:RKO91685.1 hypothetical protein BDK51DRAFT_48725 [Blyttiomyces helicus]
MLPSRSTAANSDGFHPRSRPADHHPSIHPPPMSTSSLRVGSSSQPPSLLTLPLDILDPTLETLFPLKHWSTAQIHASEARQRALLCQPSAREYIEYGRFPTDDHFLSRIDLANAALPNLRRLSFCTNSLVVADVFPVTLSELIIVPGPEVAYENGFLVKLVRRLPRLERLTVTSPALAGDVPPAEAWEGSSLRSLTVDRLNRTGAGARGFIRHERLAFFPPGLVHLFIKEDGIPSVAFGDAILPSLANLEALNLSEGYYNMECVALLRNLGQAGRLPPLSELGIGCCGNLRNPEDRASLSAALEDVLGSLKSTCTKVSVGWDCLLKRIHGDGRICRLYSTAITLRLGALPSNLQPAVASESLLPRDLRDLTLAAEYAPLPPLPSLRSLTLWVSPAMKFPDLLSSLPSLTTLNLVDGSEPHDISENNFHDRFPYEDIPVPRYCEFVTDAVAVALPPSVHALNIHGLHHISAPRIAALRARGVRVFMASETTEVRRFFWAYEREPGRSQREHGRWTHEAQYYDVGVKDLPQTDAEMISWIAGDREEDDEDGEDEEGSEDENDGGEEH